MSRPVCVALLLVAGCGNRPARYFPPSADLASPFALDGGAPNPDPNPIDPGPGPIDPCDERAKLVYVVDQDNRLSSFKPDLLQFKDIGILRCPAEPEATPFSMAVDRTATAWVLYSSGELFRVDTTNAKCQATKYLPGQNGFDNFGMGFAANTAGGNDETLFISGTGFGGLSDGELGTLNVQTLKTAKLGVLMGSPELTGTGDANLWGFFPDDVAPRVAQLDKKSARELKKYPLNKISGAPSAWAFAFWGGDFWIFLKRVNDPSTQVHRLKQNSAFSTPLPNTGRTIVGAGVSTCAPIQPPG